MVKTVFVSVNIQHASALRPIYKEMVRQGYDAEFGEVKTREQLAQLYEGLWPWKGDIYVFSGVTEQLRESHEKTKRAIYHPHGVGDESPVFWDIMKVLTTGPKLHQQYVEAYPSEAFRFFLVGFPKTDILFKPERKELEKQLRNRLNLPFDKTILFTGFYYYLENYEKWHPILCRTLLKIMRMAEDTEHYPYNWIIKPHLSTMSVSDHHHHIPLKDEGYTVPKDLLDPKIGAPYSVYRGHFHGLKNVKWISPLIADVTPLYLISNICIGGDGSSCLFEFMTLDKPTIAIDEMEKGFQLNPCLHATDQDLNEAIQRCFSRPDEFKEERRKCVRERIYLPDGHASERAVKAIMEPIQ